MSRLWGFNPARNIKVSVRKWSRPWMFSGIFFSIVLHRLTSKRTQQWGIWGKMIRWSILLKLVLTRKTRKQCLFPYESWRWLRITQVIFVYPIHEMSPCATMTEPKSTRMVGDSGHANLISGGVLIFYLVTTSHFCLYFPSFFRTFLKKMLRLNFDNCEWSTSKCPCFYMF